MATDINPIQQMQLDLIRSSRFNRFDGEKVADDLIANRNLWRGVIMDRLGEGWELLKLRDIEHGHWNVDTLCILSSQVDDAALEALAGTWQAQEIDWLEGEEVMALGSSPDERVLIVWWD